MKFPTNEAKALKIAWGLRIFFAGVALFLPLGHPHIWRQVDTLGVSLRYWMRWTIESPSPWPLLPAVLHSGDGSGIMAMEWPLLNILAAPLFAFGPALGTALARALVLGLTLGLVLWNIRLWREQRPAGISASKSWRWMPLLGLGLVFFPKFIPDPTAMLLALSATAFLYQGKNRSVATLLLLTALLMKPTAVIVLALLLLAPEPWPVLRKAALPLALAFASTALYYLKGTSWIQALAEGESLYRLGPQNPLHALREFFIPLSRPAALFAWGLSFYGGLPLLMLLALLGKIRRLGRVWLLLLLQILAIAALDGGHSFKHSYYYIGTLPLVCLLLQAAQEDLGQNPRPSLWPSVLLLLGIGSALNQLGFDWAPLYKTAPVDRFLSFRDCEALKAGLPAWPWNRAAVFRTSPRPYPLVGLCFGERVGSDQAAYGLYVVGDALPGDCQEVRRVGTVIAARCGL